MFKNLAFLISGTGSLMGHALEHGIPAALVIADRPCKGLEVADDHGIRNILVDKDALDVKPKVFDGARDRFSLEVAKELNRYDIDLVSMAGWDTIVTRPYFKTFRGRTINNHPAILPAFKGSSRAVRDAIRAGVLVTGYTIHVATEVVDQGQILEQEAVRVLPDDDEGSLHERLEKLERPGLVRVLRNEMYIPPEAPPYCYRCAIQMVQAGSTHACPSCRATPQASS